MSWINEPNLCENMDGCQLQGCTNYTVDPTCPYNFGEACIIAHLCFFTYTK